MTQIFPSPAAYVVVYQIPEGPNAGTYTHLNQTGYLAESMEFYRDHSKAPFAAAVLLDGQGRVWDQGAGSFVDPLPRSAEGIRVAISRLEGELARLAGKPILIRDGTNGGTVCADIPPGGALLTIETGIAEQSRELWYPDLEAAKADLVLLWREHHGDLAKGGLYLDADPIRAYITRREQPSLIDTVCAECGKPFDGGPTEETHKGRCHASCARGRRFVASAGS